MAPFGSAIFFFFVRRATGIFIRVCLRKTPRAIACIENEQEALISKNIFFFRNVDQHCTYSRRVLLHRMFLCSITELLRLRHGIPPVRRPLRFGVLHPIAHWQFQITQSAAKLGLGWGGVRYFRYVRLSGVLGSDSQCDPIDAHRSRSLPPINQRGAEEDHSSGGHPAGPGRRWFHRIWKRLWG